MTRWNFFWCSIPADDFTVAGESFFKSVKLWKTTEMAEVVDPIYGKTFPFPVYVLKHGDLTLKVACKEHTPSVYVAFADDETLPLRTPKFRWDREAKWIRIDQG
jgi:hypothetical protein